MARRFLDGNLPFLLDRQFEEALRLGKDLLGRRARNAVTGQIEEADVSAGLADLAGDIPPLIRRTSQEGREIDEWDLVQRHALAHEAGIEPCRGRLLRYHAEISSRPG